MGSRRTTAPGFDKGQLSDGHTPNIPGQFELMAAGTAPARTIVTTGVQESDISYTLPASLSDGVLYNIGGRLFWSRDAGVITKTGIVIARNWMPAGEGCWHSLVPVIFTEPFPDDEYIVLLTIYGGAFCARDFIRANVRQGSKRPRGFQVIVEAHANYSFISNCHVMWLAREQPGEDGGPYGYEYGYDDDRPPAPWQPDWPICMPWRDLKVFVSGAGDNGVNGLYNVQQGTLNGRRFFLDYTGRFIIYWTGDCWEISHIFDWTQRYWSESDTLSTTAWRVGAFGTEPPPASRMICGE